MGCVLMNSIDISWPLSAGVTTYKNKGDFKTAATRNWQEHHARESSIYIGSHTGTHVDAPAHFLEQGKTIEHTELSRLIGKAQVIDLGFIETEGITREHLERISLNAPRVLLKTKNSLLDPEADFNPEFIYLEKSGARYLADQGILSVGIDYLGIERLQPAHETHQALLEHDIAIIEGLRLGCVPEGLYTLVCLPLALMGTEAAPARAVLLADQAL
jgi:arylformamidase